LISLLISLRGVAGAAETDRRYAECLALRKRTGATGIPVAPVRFGVARPEP
jgi:hypothetical protein